MFLYLFFVFHLIVVCVYFTYCFIVKFKFFTTSVFMAFPELELFLLFFWLCVSVLSYHCLFLLLFSFPLLNI